MDYIYANVALNYKNEIVAWHTVDYKKDLMFWTIRFKCQKDAVKTKHKKFELKNESDRNYIFDKLSVDFYKKFKIADNYEGNRPY